MTPSRCRDSSWHGKTKAIGQSTSAGAPGSTTSENGSVTGTRGADTASGKVPSVPPSRARSRTIPASGGTTPRSTRPSRAAGPPPMSGTGASATTRTAVPSTTPNSATTLVPVRRVPLVVTTSGTPASRGDGELEPPGHQAGRSGAVLAGVTGGSPAGQVGAGHRQVRSAGVPAVGHLDEPVEHRFAGHLGRRGEQARGGIGLHPSSSASPHGFPSTVAAASAASE